MDVNKAILEGMLLEDTFNNIIEEAGIIQKIKDKYKAWKKKIAEEHAETIAKMKAQQEYYEAKKKGEYIKNEYTPKQIADEIFSAVNKECNWIKRGVDFHENKYEWGLTIQNTTNEKANDKDYDGSEYINKVEEALRKALDKYDFHKDNVRAEVVDSDSFWDGGWICVSITCYGWYKYNGKMYQEI